MIKTLKQVLCLILALLGIVACFVGCASQGKTMMELDKTKMSVNMFQLFLSRTKGTLCASYSFGAEALVDSFWDKWIDTKGTTYNDFYTDAVLEEAKNYLAALYLFDQKKLKLPDSYLEEIEEKMDRLVEEDGEGSKAKLNEILADYGANYKILKESYILEAKVEHLKNTLFGANGELISDQLIEDYYQDTYARFKQVFLYTYDYVYVTDSDGQDIYYKKNGTIAYDTKATPKTDSQGTLVKDKNGDQIYVTADGKVAYDKENGTRQHTFDKEGNAIVADLKGNELQAVIDKANQIVEKIQEGDYEGFDQLVKDYGEDAAMEKYTNGYYLTATTNFDSKEVVKALFELKEGESEMVRSQYGIHIIMRYELEEGGYKSKDNSDFFISTTTGRYIFLPALKNIILTDYLEQYKEKILLDETIFEAADIKSVGANFYY